MATTVPIGKATVSAIAVAPHHSNIVWVAYANSTVVKTSEALNANPTWIVVDSVVAVPDDDFAVELSHCERWARLDIGRTGGCFSPH